MPDTPPNQRGGRRLNAGRKAGTGAFGEPTAPVRIPVSLVPAVKAALSRASRLPEVVDLLPFTDSPSKLSLPLYISKVSAGFPSPADDYIEKSLDLNELLVQQPASTFFGRATGESMLGAGIHPNDILVIDRAIEPSAGKIVVCVLNGEMVVKCLEKDQSGWRLVAKNPAYPDVIVGENDDLIIWGVVTSVIHPL